MLRPAADSPVDLAGQEVEYRLRLARAKDRLRGAHLVCHPDHQWAECPAEAYRVVAVPVALVSRAALDFLADLASQAARVGGASQAGLDRRAVRRAAATKTKLPATLWN